MRRRLTSAAAVFTLACAGGCAGLQLRERLAGARGTPIITVDNASFDGETLTGRLLIGSTDAGYVVVDRRLFPHAIIVVDDVLDCDGGAPIRYLAADAVITSQRPEDFQFIEPGYWYGSDFKLILHDEKMVGQPAPACVQALLAVNFEAAAPGTDRPQVLVHAQRAGTDGGNE